MASKVETPFGGQPFDSKIPPGVDEYDQSAIFNDVLNLDDEPLFQDDWNHQDTPPYDQGLYSTPLSWEPPQTRAPVEEKVQTIQPTNVVTLTTAQQELLRSIAMPEHIQYPSENSPESATTYKSGSVSSPEQQDQTRKRKSSVEDDDEDDGEEAGQRPVKKTAHNMIEKRYRTNLNDKIAALRDSVPSLRVMSKSSRGEDASGEKEDLEGLTPAHKLNKATVLAKATEYIRHLEKRGKRLAEDNASMKARIAAFEKLFLSGAMGVSVNPVPRMNPFQYNQEQMYTDSATNQITPNVSPRGMIEIPEEFRRIHAAQQLNQQTYQMPQDAYQQQQQQQQQQQMNRVSGGTGWNTGGYFGKMMVGSLAGLMILEGFSESESQGEADSRGLFALPTQLLGTLGRTLRSFGEINFLGYHSSSSQTLGYLKLMLVIGVLLYVFIPSFFSKAAKANGQKISTRTISPAPSLASPIQVRRQAWLTAVQTVWVPRHNFFLEAAALCLKMIKLSIRNASGWYGYSLLTGITEQEETARVKTWSIALDAQLVGGDVEVSKSRLILTLLASGTLPATPARLMQKALHIRILLWEMGKTGFYGFYLFEALAAKLARRQWNEARQLQQLLIHAHAKSPAQDFEPLPEHLATLLEQKCDDVLADKIIQRAYNLAWNLPTAHNSVGGSDGMDGVVDDHSIRSPLDALAGWWSSITLQSALEESLRSSDGRIEAVAHNIDLAIKTAPVDSVARIRAFLARAALVDEKRGANIASAAQELQSYTPLKPEDTDAEAIPSLMTTPPTLSSLPELQMTLECAKAMAHLNRSEAPEALITAYAIVNSLQPQTLSLLGFASVYKLVEKLVENDEAARQCPLALESLSGVLRTWLGGAEGIKSGVDKQTKDRVAEKCINIIRKSVLGMEKDDGYQSMSEEDLGEGC